jgi:hypothetical protein
VLGAAGAACTNCGSTSRMFVPPPYPPSIRLSLTIAPLPAIVVRPPLMLPQMMAKLPLIVTFVSGGLLPPRLYNPPPNWRALLPLMITF